MIDVFFLVAEPFSVDDFFNLTVFLPDEIFFFENFSFLFSSNCLSSSEILGLLSVSSSLGISDVCGCSSLLSSFSGGLGDSLFWRSGRGLTDSLSLTLFMRSACLGGGDRRRDEL